MNIRRLQPTDAAAIVDCFRRVYGDSYANELFYDAARLAEHLGDGRLGSVGALDDAGRLLGHMAMTVRVGARTVELGNTVVDPAARGQGLAWRIGAELKAWCVELGYRGYLHYPTTDHHIMQRQSVKGGFEVGLMLGYIPAETSGGVHAHGADAHEADADKADGHRAAVRQAATIVYEPLGEADPASPTAVAYLPDHAADFLRAFAAATGLARDWRPPGAPATGPCEARALRLEKRGLARLTVARVGADIGPRLQAFDADAMPCRQLDLRLDDPGIQAGVDAARALGYWFCGWLPGFGTGDVYRLQQVDRRRTDMAPTLVNPVARALLRLADAAART